VITRGFPASVLATALLLTLGGCGASHHTPDRPSSLAASPPAIPAASAVSSAAANERLLAYSFTQPIPAIPAQTIAGAEMLAYAQFEHAYAAALAAIGQPAPTPSVTQITGGFKLCASGTVDASACDTFTEFTTNQEGQITGASVNGQPIAGRIATAPNASSGGLTISNVVSYQLTDAQNQVSVAFMLTDNSYRPINTSPALLASLNGASDDVNEDALPATLAPGDTLYAEAGFDVPQITGLFCLEPNDGFGEHLPCATLSKV
jgi:hypothetical protein